LVRARTVHFERSLWLDAALAALAVAAVGAAVLFGAVVESTGGSPLAAGVKLRGPPAGAPPLRRRRRRSRDYRLAARPGLVVHPRKHGGARTCRQRRPLPGSGRLGDQR